MQLPIPLHEHRKLCHHWSEHRLTCDKYDLMHWRASGRCEICNRLVREVQTTPLGIDHDHRLGTGIDHIRGLLCAKCNCRLNFVDNGHRPPTTEELRYIQRSWFWQWLAPEQIDDPYLPTNSPGRPSSSGDLWASPAYWRRCQEGRVDETTLKCYPPTYKTPTWPGVPIPRAA